MAASLEQLAGNKWRSIAQQRGLLKQCKEAEDEDGSKLPPTHSCGVSLAYLETFASAVRAAKSDYGLADDTTTTVMHSLVMPTLSKAFNKGR